VLVAVIIIVVSDTVANNIAVISLFNFCNSVRRLSVVLLIAVREANCQNFSIEWGCVVSN
jgi:hypothetical protein